MKYIDAEKLEKRVTKLITSARQNDWPIAEDYLKMVINIIKSLQQEQPNAYENAMLEVKEYVDKLYDDTSIGLNEYDSGLYNGIAETCMKLRGFIKARTSKEQPNNMIQWTGNNLKEVIDFTGKSPRFGEWFNSWEEYENYVHTHNDILKLFCEDGSHYEVPIGAWIIKTPDGYNTPSRFRFIQKPAEWSEEDEFMRDTVLNTLEKIGDYGTIGMQKDWLKSLRPQPISQPSTNHTIWHNASEEKPTKLPIIHIWYHGNRVNAVVAHENISLQAELDDINFQPDDKWAYVEDLLNAQPHWKPSEEQMDELLAAIECLETQNEDVSILDSIYNELKKL